MVRAPELLLVALPLGAWLSAGPGRAEDPAKALRSQDPMVRLGAVEALATGDEPKREKLLQDALKDVDWEVVERAATVLGAVGSEDSADVLAKLALEGPVARVRRAAAEALGRLAPEDGFDELAKKVASDEAAAACLGMCALLDAGAVGLDGKVSLKPLARALKSKEVEHRVAAARALVRLSGAGRAERLAELLEHEEVAVRCAAIEAVGHAPADDPRLVALLLKHLAGDACSEPAEHRIPVALARQLASAEDDARATSIAAVCAAPKAGDAARQPQLVRMLGRVAALEVAAVPAEDALASLGALYKSAGEPTRAAIADALGRIGTDAALLQARTIAREERSARARRAALRAVMRRRSTADDDNARGLAIDLCADENAGVRADAAVALGVSGPDAAEVLRPLIGLLSDPEWEVAAVAAVSLGKTREAEGVAELIELAQSESWRLRGAAIVGLGHTYQKEAVPTLIAALEDADPLLRRTAHEILCALAKRRIDPNPAQWTEWWEENEKRVALVDPDEEQARRDRYGYERTAAEIYAGLDVLVLESRGDHIQDVLTGLGIEHRMTTAGRVAEDGPQPRCVFVANCTGEMNDEDVARLRWFVQTGGYLFGSCWAVHETIARVVPGVVESIETRGEVTGDVPASPCAASPYLEGVFGRDVVPIYALLGAHLIRVLDPERVEVLVDSPQCHDRWGGGNLAAWFRAGHGVVLDSVNHFDEQGLARATWLKKPEERQAYAVDHLGLSYEDLRTTREERWWKKTTESAEQVKDLSVFRLITNFVRQKRIEGGG